MSPDRTVVERCLCSLVSFIVLMCTSAQAMAGVVIDRTRVVFDAKSDEMVVQLYNDDPIPYVVQTWIDDGGDEASPEKSKVPFLLLPPIRRIDPDRSLSLQLKALDADLPADRESLFWINVLAIPGETAPGAAADGVLRLAIATRVKLFWRPSGLPGDASRAAEALRWHVHQLVSGRCELQVENPSAFYVTLTQTKIGASNPFEDGEMVEPFSTLRHDMECMPDTQQVHFSSVDDLGVIREHHDRLQKQGFPSKDQTTVDQIP